MCNGCLCQGAGDKNDPCGCISASNHAIGLTTDLYCPEFELDRVDVPIVKYTSVPLGITVMAEKFDVLSMESHDIDDGVRRFTAVQIENEGFRIVGWCRDPKESDDSISDAKIMDVVSCLPEGNLSEEAKNARLKPQNNESNE